MNYEIITYDKYKDLYWKNFENFSFAEKEHILPITLNEISKIASQLPIGIVKIENEYRLITIFSLIPETNFYINQKNWLLDYIPNYLRVYPFKLYKAPVKKEYSLTIDLDSNLIDNTIGFKFFEDKDKPTALINLIFNFLLELEKNQLDTQKAINLAEKMDLIEPWPLKIVMKDNDVPVDDLYRFSIQKFQSLDNKHFLRLRSHKLLEIIILQIQSMQHINRLKNLLDKESHEKYKLFLSNSIEEDQKKELKRIKKDLVFENNPILDDNVNQIILS
jgi:hypothetical protein